MHDAFITPQGLRKLKEELTELQTTKRLAIAERLKVAMSFGDLSENAEYAEAKEDQAFLEGRIAEIYNILRSASLVSENSARKTSVQIGCEVRLVSGGKTQTFKILGKGEGDPLRGEISSDSPIGRAVLGRRDGEEFEVPAPVGNKKYRIVKIA